MKAVPLVVVTIAVAILGIGLWKVIATPTSIPAIHQETPGTVSSSTIMVESDTYIIKDEYPQFDIPAIDTQIKTDIENVLAEFKTLPQNPHDSATPRNGFVGTFDHVYVDEDIVSVQLILSQDTGGAHPLTLFSGVVFDRHTGKRLLLGDVLPLIGKSTEDVARVATAEFREKFGEGFFSEGATSNPENFSSFLVMKDSVSFIFQQYQVEAYAYGPQQVSFPRVK